MDASPNFTYVDSPDSLKSLVRKLAKAERIALDTEANSLHQYYQKVCLVQLTFDQENYILDPLAELTLDPFLELIAKKPLIFHAGDYDLRMMRASFGFVPHKPVFDTMLAAQLLGCASIGLVEVARQYLDIALTKQGQKSDWSRRPLSPAQLDYASDDTRYLAQLADTMRGELEALGRLEWHEESCARMVAAATAESERDDDDRWRIKGSGLLDRRTLAFVRAVWEWRDEEAQRADRPPFKILGNIEIIELAQWSVAHPESELEEGPRLPRSCTGPRLAKLKGGLRRARQLPESEWPERRKRSGLPPVPPEEKALLDRLQKACAGIGEELGLTASLIASRATLAQIAHKRPKSHEALLESAPLMRWQAGLIGPKVLPLFQ